MCWMVFVAELSVGEVFCVAGRIWWPACGSRLGITFQVTHIAVGNFIEMKSNLLEMLIRV